ncbi:MAG: hypothetical protein GQ569_12340, partial [Methylococcaceae bacterium]|nr:hypothetical protein [Methylococcaceae bacterium]
ANTPKSALGAIAMSSDGSQLVVAGDNRVLYVLDPKTLEVTKRVWIKVNPYEMFFSKDGSVLAIEESGSALYFYDTKTWELKASTKERSVGNVAHAADADLLAGFSSSSKGTTVKLFNIADAKEVASFEIAEKLEAIAITPDGKQLAGITKSIKTDKEKRTKAPKELKDLARLKFEQQNDEKMSKIIWFDAAGKVGVQVESWYSSRGNTRLAMPTAAAVYVINYSNKNAVVPQKGEVSLFKLNNSYNYGIGVSLDQTQVGTGGLRNGSVTKLADAVNGATFKIDSLPSWPEYFKGFIVAKDGTAYGVTTAYRLAKVKANGEIEKVVPVF